MRNTARPRQAPPGGPARLVGLSDGLFATVLTLLVLDLKIPEALAPAGGTGGFQKWLGPRLFSYLLTFLVSGTYWMGHHRDFDHVVRYDRTLMSYNLLFLLFIGLFPFTTATMGQIGFASDSYPFYWALYAINVSCAGLMLTLTWAYAFRHGLVRRSIPPAEVRRITARQLLIPAVFLASIGAEYAAPKVFLGPYAAVAIPPGLWIIDRVTAVRGPRRTAPRARWTSLLWRAGTLVPWLLIIGVAWAISP